VIPMNAIAILDNGGQFTHLIANVVRNELNVRANILDPDTDNEQLKEYMGIILSGGPSSLDDEDAPPFNENVFLLDIPILGLCYGHYLMARHYGGTIVPGTHKEYGFANLTINENSDIGGIFKGLQAEEQVWMSHGDSVAAIPDGFDVIGSTESCFSAAVGDAKRKRFGFQFHPEVKDTLNGVTMLRNFVVDICECDQDWTIDNYVGWKTEELRKEIGEKKVLVLVSGGVDSTVCAALLSNTIPPSNLFAIHIDNGLMRQGESQRVVATLNEIGVMNVKLVDASTEFLKALEGKVHPEEKREIIGNEFVEVSNREAEALKLTNWLLAQGTIYPDTIESGGTKHAQVIKTHHNRVEMIQQMIAQGKIVEPLKDLYKVEVRKLGKVLGLPDELVNRHPFPGPGLGARVLCSDGKAEDVSVVQGEVNLRLGDDMGSLVLPIKSVGVKGDGRSYEHPALVIPKKPGVTMAQIKRVGIGLCNTIKGLNRVVMLMEPSDLADISLVEGYMTKERLSKVREADFIVMQALKKHGIYHEIWQCPTVLLPIELNDGELIIVRPIHSDRAMTAEAALPKQEFIDDVVEQIMKIPGVGGVGFDLTNKPPGTIEWE